jgi:SecD/SecF fusion protein
MGVIAAAVVGAVLFAVPGSPLYKGPTLGLDLQGGLEVILRAVPQKGQTINATQMQTAQSIMESRVNKIGVASPNVAVQGGNEIVIQLAGVHDPAKAAAIIGRTGQLQFFDFEKDLAPTSLNQGRPSPSTSLYTLLNPLQSAAKKGSPEAYYLIGPKTFTKTVTKTVKGKTVTKKQTTTRKHAVLQGPDRSVRQLLQPYGGKKPALAQVLVVPAHRLVAHAPGGKAWYLFKYTPKQANGPPELTGNDLNESQITADIDQNTGQPEVVLGFTGHGSKEFQDITRAEYKRGQLAAGLAGQAGNHDPTVVQQYAQHNAIVLDGVLESTPYIDYTTASPTASPAGRRSRWEPAGSERPRASRSSCRAARCPTPSSRSSGRTCPRRSARARSTRRSSRQGRGSSSSRSSCSCCTASSASSRSRVSRSMGSSTTPRSSSST